MIVLNKEDKFTQENVTKERRKVKRFITFGSILQFRNIVKNIEHQARYDGVDENGKAVYNHKPLPTLEAVASEKIHGTNAAVCYSNTDGFWVQSRNNIITSEQDNQNCARHQEANEAAWVSIIKQLAKHHEIDLDTHIISIYFEWSGGNIQKLSALSGVEKSAMIFQHFKVSTLLPQDTEDVNAEHSEWYETHNGVSWVSNPDQSIYNIMDYKPWTFEINFDNPAKSQNDMIEYVVKIIEPNSPVGQYLGKDGNTGEGIVVTLSYKGTLHKFKVKGEKHSNSKVRTLKPVDEAKENAKREFVNYACAGWRLEQMFSETFSEETGFEADIKHTGDFLRAVVRDVMKEESDILEERDLEPKDVNALISRVARQWFMEQLQDF